MGRVSLVVENAEIVDVERGVSRAGSIAVADGRILAVGAADEIAPLKRGAAQVLDLAGKTVLPGFIDAHAHLAATGGALLGPDLRKATCIRDVQDLVAGAASALRPGTFVQAWGLQENLLREGRFPTREELDVVAPQHFVRLFRADGHSSVVNSRALDYLGFGPGMPGVEVVDGGPTGVLRARAQAEADGRLQRLETEEMREQGLRRAADLALRAGLTTVHALEGSDNRPHEEFVAAAGALAALPLHIVLWYQTTRLERVEELGLGRIGGCIMVDGAPGSYTGALFEPYADNPETSGVLYFTDEELVSFISRAHGKGYHLALHATCQRAVEQLLTAYEKTLDAHPRNDHRMRIEHAYGLPTQAQYERMGRRGIILSTQPAFLHDRMDMYYRRFGARWRQVHPHRMALQHGVVVAGGSDSPVTPLSPLLGIHCAVNHPVEDQRVGVREALRWFTCNAAFAGFEEGYKGTIEPGKLADLVVLARNLLTENALTIKDIPVVTTIVEGYVRYAAGPEQEYERGRWQA